MTSSLEDLKCVWMSSGVVEYKLCDKNFDCENCRFDKVIRNISSEDSFTNLDLGDQTTSDILNKTIHFFEDQIIDNEVIYLNKAACLKKVFANKYYIKLVDPLTALLGRNSKVEFISNSDFIWKDDNWISVSNNFGKIVIKAPISFNQISKFKSEKESGENKNWLSLIEVSEDDLAREKQSINDMKQLMNQTLSQLYLFKKSIFVDNTMYDGGEKAESLSMVIGKNNHMNLIKKYI
ncbi:MAG: hypothetical protein K9J12_15845 [Melioribacteraceae bacterium]|nr:hypothetical protein [Melioribacteraceae bacterium]MCF8263684.1 hypothetical protein [Melioribacteraceae bacterium]MCF8414377.1 hypothetical protein [Melioribacteraceae bacterium]MCF8431069.1 hypothetical protein [Melioribacteraceae bacterium]